MSKDKTLYVMVGLPRSGKTTRALEMGQPVVNPDAIRLSLHGMRYQAESEPMVWSIAQYMVRSLFIVGHNVVILDATNNTKKRRDMWISDKWETIFVHVDTSCEECVRRAQSEGDTDIIPIIYHMSMAFEPLNQTEEGR